MNGAMGFELVPHATDYRAAPTPETLSHSKSKRILHKPRAGIYNQMVFLPLWAISSPGQGLSLEFQIIQDATAPVSAGVAHRGNFQMFEFLGMFCIVTKVCKILMQGIC